MKRFLIILTIVILVSYVFFHKRYIDTIRLTTACNRKLYVETYVVGFGFAQASYLTDSVNFKKYMGIYDDETGIISYQCLGDSIVVEKDERIEFNKLDTTFINGKMNVKQNVHYKTNTEIHYYKLADL